MNGFGCFRWGGLWRSLILAGVMTIFIAVAASGGDGVVVERDTVLKTEYGDLRCPAGSVMTGLGRGAGGVRVKGILFGVEVEGVLPTAAFESGTDFDSEGGVEIPEKFIYLGRLRDREFLNELYEMVRNNYVVCGGGGIKSLFELPVVDSTLDLLELRAGDLVVLDGLIRYRPNFAVVRIYNAAGNRRDQPLMLMNIAKMGKDGEEPFKPYVGYAEYLAEDVGRRSIPSFRHLELDDILIGRREFVGALEKGMEFGMRCGSCNGTGSKDGDGKWDGSAKTKCRHCNGTGMLSPARTADIARLKARRR